MPYSDYSKRRRYQREWVKRRRAKAIELKGGKCIKCSRTTGLEFHHRDPNEKESHRIWSWAWKRILAEIAKCDLLCSDCHLPYTQIQAADKARQLLREDNGRFQQVAA